MSLITAMATENDVSADVEQATLPHVLLVLDQFPKTLGGGERIVLRLAALLPQYGYRVSILTFLVHPQSLVNRVSTCPIYVLSLKRTYDMTALRAAFELRRFLKLHRIQIVQTFFESSDIWAGFITKAASRAKLVWSRRDMGILRSGKHHVAYRFMAHAPDAVFAVSEQVRQYCIEVDRIPSDRVRTIYNGLDLGDWSAPSRVTGASDFVVTTVGNIRRVKGHDVFIKAAALVLARFPDALFSIAGDVLEPEYFNELQSLIQSLNLSGSFRFVGGVTDLQQFLHGADVFVLPSRSEGFSNAIIEAMAAALPVVATCVGGNAEAVADGVTGFLVGPDDPAALAAAITRLLMDPSMGRQMGVAGREVVLKRFTTGAMMEQITNAYKGLLKK